MRFVPTSLEGVILIETEPRTDARGHFARTYCEQEFARVGLNTVWPQCSLSVSLRQGILRGLHYQADPKPEIKLVRCEAGAIFDVVVDIRKESPTFGKWNSFNLIADSSSMLYIPRGFAHGFQCLTDNVHVFYQMSEFYHPELARGIRWNDPALRISWPLADPELSDRDKVLPLLTDV